MYGLCENLEANIVTLKVDIGLREHVGDWLQRISKCLWKIHIYFGL